MRRRTVDNGHLVAWTAQYKVERINAGGFLSGAHTDEGLVCRYVVFLLFYPDQVLCSKFPILDSPVLGSCTFRRGIPKPSALGSGSKSLNRLIISDLL